MPQLDYLCIDSGQEPTASVIWLHGLGASGHDFESVVPHLKLPINLPVRFIFPHAPEIPVTVNGGYVMPAWYDILEMSLERKIDHAQIKQSSAAVVELIEQEIARGVPSERIVLAGFSQGGAVAYECALSYNKPLAGVIAMSTYFATDQSIDTHSANAATPIYIFHGDDDAVVPESMGQSAQQVLAARGYTTHYKSYHLLEHNLCLEEVQDISQVLQNVLA